MAIVALLASILSALGTEQQAQAAGTWPVTVSSSQTVDRITVDPSGGVTASKCPGGSGSKSTAFSMYSSDATLINSATSSSPTVAKYFCYPLFATRSSGWAYGVDTVNGEATYRIVGYQGSIQKWAATLPNQCSGSTYTPIPTDVVIGQDGRVYAHYVSSPCMAARVLAINAGTGRVEATFNLGSSSSAAYGILTSKSYMKAYQNGLIVRVGDGGAFRYFSYKGVEAVAKKFTPSVASNQVAVEWGVSYEGDVFVVLEGNNSYRTSGCAVYTVVERLIKRSITGVTTSYDLEAQCMRLQDFATTPEGGAALTSKYDYTPAAKPLVIVHPDGTIDTPVLPWAAGYRETPYQTYSLAAGTNGNILFNRQTQQASGDYRTVTELILVDPRGGELARQLSTTLYSASSNIAYINTAEAAMVNGFVYASLCERSMPYGCNVTRIHKLTFVEAAHEYPAGRLANVAVPVDQTLDYVALGDSFSSGEGVPASSEPYFIPPSDTNGCHRSEKAYAKLLDAFPELGVSAQRTAFVACSGAKSENITTTGQYANESKQVDAITTGTDLVTLTIGGNDVGFEAYVRACLDPTQGSCGTASSAYSTIMARINDELPGELDSAYTAIAGRLSSTADVLVVGYPFVIREVAYGGTCTEIELSQLEQQAAEAVTVAINEKISEAFIRLGNPKFHFVDVLTQGSLFTGHDLCGGDSYFNNLSTPLVYTAHPNSSGQAAYATSIKNYWLSIN
jgi:lysophospholipase L1-like esterase